MSSSDDRLPSITKELILGVLPCPRREILLHVFFGSCKVVSVEDCLTFHEWATRNEMLFRKLLLEMSGREIKDFMPLDGIITANDKKPEEVT